jgi:RNA-directed DNA polymerase
MSGDVQVRFCERLGVRFPGPTHLVALAKRMGSATVEFIESKLEGKFQLEINREKTRVVDLREKGASLNFLGYTFRYDRDLKRRGRRYLNVFPSKKAV